MWIQFLGYSHSNLTQTLTEALSYSSERSSNLSNFRYVAVHYPINYSQSMNDGRALRQRMLKYLLPVFCLTIVFNVTKFFEATYDDGKCRETMD